MHLLVKAFAEGVHKVGYIILALVLFAVALNTHNLAKKEKLKGNVSNYRASSLSALSLVATGLIFLAANLHIGKHLWLLMIFVAISGVACSYAALYIRYIRREIKSTVINNCLDISQSQNYSDDATIWPPAPKKTENDDSLENQAHKR